jgi:hypothetical protein
MDVVKETLLILKTLGPGALFVVALGLITFAIARVGPYIFKAEEAKNVLKTKKVEADAEQVRDENQQENTWLSIFEKQTAIQDRHLKLLDGIEQRTQERHLEGMKIMLDTKAQRDARLAEIQNALVHIPAHVVDAQEQQFKSLDANIREMYKRLESVEKNIPSAIQTMIQPDLNIIREQISELARSFNEGIKANGTEQRIMGSSPAVGSTGGVDLVGVSDRGERSLPSISENRGVVEVAPNDVHGGGRPADGLGGGNSLGAGEATKDQRIA